jgi:hypothetical protein
MKVRITSEPYTGRYVGPTFSGLITNPALISNPPIMLTGSSYSAYVQEEPATNFFEHKAIDVQGELKKLGLNSELVP